MRKKIIYISLVVALVVGVMAFVGYRMFFGSAVDKSFTVELREGESYDEMVAKVKAGIDNHMAFDYYADHLNLASTIKPGCYEIKEGMTVIDIVRMLKIGVRNTSKIIINNVRTPEALAAKIATSIDIDEEELVQLLTSEEYAKECGFDSPMALFASFLPNTYEVDSNVTPRELLDCLRRESMKYWQREEVRSRLDALVANTPIEGWYDVMVLASIVHEETKAEDEMARVAGVYINRLNRPMLLQADPTVKYAVGDPTLKRILNKHLEVDSPYNTYKHLGLPPTPISMPDMAAIEAVLSYEKHDYIYFCARPELDGRHNFARTLSEHNRNAKAYHNAINKLK